MNAARQTRVEAAHGAHNVDPFEVLRAILFKNRRVLNRVFVRPGGSIDIARVGVPRCRRIRMVVRDLTVANDHMMGQHAAYGFVEPAADAGLRYLEIPERLSISLM